MSYPLTPSSTIPLHRIRFFDHTPSPITALAFAPTPLPPPRDPSDKGKSKDQSAAHAHRESGDKVEFGPLLLARESGDVEIWEYVREEESHFSGNWVLEKTLPPTLVNPTISTMALVIRDPLNFHRKSYHVPQIEDLRLFTAGSDSTELAERCLLSGKVLQTYPIPSPPLWSLSVAPTHDLLCLATSSPSLHFVSIPPPISPSSPFTALEPPPSHLLRCDALPSRTRTVSIAWGVPKLEKVAAGEWEWRNTTIATGNSDSSWRKWELPPPYDPGRGGVNRVVLKSRAVVEKVAKGGRGGKKAQSGSGAGRATIVWGVGILPDGDVVTSDSLGNVTFWDSASMAQRQSFRAHKADGMCMTIGPGGRSLFTSGPDQRVCHFINVPSTSSGRSQWVLTASKRLHSHDVRALAVFPPYLPLPATHPLATAPINPHYAPVLASGGWDMSLSLTSAGSPDTASLPSTSLRNALGKPKSSAKAVFEESFSRKMGYLSGGRGNSKIVFAPKARLVLGRKDRSVGLWRVLPEEQGWEKVLEMELRLRTHLISATISPDGQWLAVSDLYEAKLFRLVSSEFDGTLQPKRIKGLVETLTTELPHLSVPSKGCGASSLLFTPSSSHLIIGLVASGQVAVLELSAEDSTARANVTKCFGVQDKLVEGRVVKGTGKVAKVNGHAHVNGNINGNGPGHGRANGLVNGDGGDVEMEESEGSDDEEDDESAEKSKVEQNPPWISCLAASDDGQWLGVADLAGRVTIFNLDTLQLHATLPTLPESPLSLSFPPSTPSLLSLTLPTNQLHFYHLEHRRILPPTPQLQALHNALASLHTPVHGSAFQPRNSGSSNSKQRERESKLLMWGFDWLATVRLDLDAVAKLKGRRTSESPLSSVSLSLSLEGLGGGSKAARKKRAREAREQRELVEASASASAAGTSDMSIDSDLAMISALIPPQTQTPSTNPSEGKDRITTGNGNGVKDEFVKIQKDKFKALLVAGWLGEDGGEIGLVERPLVDYIDELPAAFWSGSFGRS